MKSGKDAAPSVDSPVSRSQIRPVAQACPQSVESEPQRFTPSSATDEMFSQLYDELHDLASMALRNERPGHTIQTTALVHEAYLRLVDSGEFAHGSRNIFLAAASSVVRHVLVDLSRRRSAHKRPESRTRIPLDLSTIGVAGDVDLVDLDDSLSTLERFNARHGRIVEMRFFGGLNEDEAAEALGVSRSAVARDWRWARAWLSRELATRRRQLLVGDLAESSCA